MEGIFQDKLRKRISIKYVKIFSLVFISLLMIIGSTCFISAVSVSE